MRMWGVNPRYLCRKHLLGEHVEMHMFAGALLKDKNIDGFKDGLVDLSKLKERHIDLVGEMLLRGYNHESPLYLYEDISGGWINVEDNLKELARRCQECNERITSQE